MSLRVRVLAFASGDEQRRAVGLVQDDPHCCRYSSLGRPKSATARAGLPQRVEPPPTRHPREARRLSHPHLRGRVTAFDDPSARGPAAAAPASRSADPYTPSSSRCGPADPALRVYWSLFLTKVCPFAQTRHCRRIRRDPAPQQPHGTVGSNPSPDRINAAFCPSLSAGFLPISLLRFSPRVTRDSVVPDDSTPFLTSCSTPGLRN